MSGPTISKDLKTFEANKPAPLVSVQKARDIQPKETGFQSNPSPEGPQDKFISTKNYAGLMNKVTTACGKANIDFNAFWFNTLKVLGLDYAEYESLAEEKKCILLFHIANKFDEIEKYEKEHGVTDTKHNIGEKVLIDLGAANHGLKKIYNGKALKDLSVEELVDGYHQHLIKMQSSASKITPEIKNKINNSIDRMISMLIPMTKGKEQVLISLKHSSSMVEGTNTLKKFGTDISKIDAKTLTESAEYRNKIDNYDEKDVKEATLEIVSVKNAEESEQFHSDLNEIRENGSSDLQFIYNDISFGYRMGLEFNQIMSQEEVENAIQNWETSEAKYYTPEEFENLKSNISKAVQDYIQEHPEAEPRTEKKAEKAGESSQTAPAKSSSAGKGNEVLTDAVIWARTDTENAKINNAVKTTTQELLTAINSKSQDNETQEIKNKAQASIDVIGTLITRHGFDAVAKSSVGAKKAILAVMTNPALANQVYHISDYIDRFDKDELSQIPYTSAALQTVLRCNLPMDSKIALAETLVKNPLGYNQKQIAEKTLDKINDNEKNIAA